MKSDLIWTLLKASNFMLFSMIQHNLLKSSNIANEFIPEPEKTARITKKSKQKAFLWLVRVCSLVSTHNGCVSDFKGSALCQILTQDS